MITILAIAVVLVQRIVKVKDLVLLPLYWSDCEPPSCLNFPKSIKLPPANVEASGDISSSASSSEPKGVTTAQQRVKQFPSEELVVSRKSYFCQAC